MNAYRMDIGPCWIAIGPCRKRVSVSKREAKMQSSPEGGDTMDARQGRKARHGCKAWMQGMDDIESDLVTDGVKTESRLKRPIT